MSAYRHPPSAAAVPFIERELRFGARNYDPLRVVLARGEGSWVADVAGRRYLDLMSAYSAVSFGHGHPMIVKALIDQAQKLAVTSRAFYNDELPLLLERTARLTGLPRALPSNGGAEAVETALKAMRKWGYRVKGIAPDRAEIIVCRNNFHGRTITIVGFSSEAQYRDGFGPFPPGFRAIPYGDAAALAAAITPNTAGFLVEPVQGEGGIIVPPDGYLTECARICREHRVLFVCDEIQTGLGRTGYALGCEHDGARPDGIILGKALGGGLLPVSLFAATDELMGVFTPGDHGNTFGGNPLASAVAVAALDVLENEELVPRSALLGAWLMTELRNIDCPVIADVRGRGLFIGIEIDGRYATAREFVERLLDHRILSKDTHGTVVRVAPPLTIAREDLTWAVGEIRAVAEEFASERVPAT